MEFCLDAQGAPVDRTALERGDGNGQAAKTSEFVNAARDSAAQIAAMVRVAERPVFLLGGGLSREAATSLRGALESASVAVMTTWNGIDRIDAAAPNYFGRPNLHGQRYANILLQQSDLIVAFGTRLGVQQTGFNWQEFAPLAKVVQYDIDRGELEKGHPKVAVPIAGDAGTALRYILAENLGDHAPWLEFAAFVKQQVPLSDPRNLTGPGYINPYDFSAQLSSVTTPEDIVIPCSSGGAYVTTMQGFLQKFGQTIINDKGLAAMGYGLSAAIGAAMANRDRRVVLMEGDGGFSQNLQELATVDINKLSIKIFIYSDEGYASIRMTQRNFFGGVYMGCDSHTGLGFPNWLRLFEAYSVPAMQLEATGVRTDGFAELFNAPGPAAFIVPIDPAQIYGPKVPARVTATGSMESAPIHLMVPDLPAETAKAVLRYLPAPSLEPA